MYFPMKPQKKVTSTNAKEIYNKSPIRVNSLTVTSFTAVMKADRDWSLETSIFTFDNHSHFV